MTSYTHLEHGCATSAGVEASNLIEAICSGRLQADALSWEGELLLRWFCREHRDAYDNRVWSLLPRGHIKHARRARRDFMDARTTHLHAAFVAARKRWPNKSALTPEQREEHRLRRLRMAFNMLPKVGQFQKQARGVTMHRAKPNGGVRPITRFDWVDQARQHVLKCALTPFADFHDAQFMHPHGEQRRGPASVRKALLAALDECSENHVLLHMDVANFYGSISHAWLEGNIGIDPAILRKHLHTGGMLIAVQGCVAFVRAQHEAKRARGQWGIPQGSMVSPLIAEQAMAAVLKSDAIFSEVPTFVWSDNIGMIVPAGRVDEIERLVREVFDQHGAGPFTLTATRHPVTSQFKFLGTWYRKAPHGAIAYIPTEIVEAWNGHVTGEIMCGGLVDLEKLGRRVRGKLATWGWHPLAKERGQRMLARIDDAWIAICTAAQA